MKINLRARLSILLCKMLRFISRILHRGGTAMPGRIAVRLCPDLLSILAEDVSVVAVTGTNGKTTCSRMIEEAFSEAGLSYFSNRSGANLMSGITTEFVMNCSLSGKMRKKYAVIECDEAASKTCFGPLNPKYIVVTNLFRDQLDRYGEITHTLSNIREGIRNAPDARLCLNADCSLTSSLAGDGLPNEIIWFGIDSGSGLKAVQTELSDASHCIRCKTEYVYDYHTYAHLGGFRCPNCGYSRHPADCAIINILSMTEEYSEVNLQCPSGVHRLRINLPASYNLYNAVAAFCVSEAVGIAPEICISALSRFSCGFGRMERFPLAGGARMILVKNPAGCTQALGYLAGITQVFILVLCLNDRGADGTDISWIWDADFELLNQLTDRLQKIYVSGDRAPELQVRLKYAGIATDRICLVQGPEKLTEALSRETMPLYILPTYTAMLELRSAVVKRTGGAEFWE
ncbi:MAG: MurT ligase domain-containing protein [Oscillospiraceae bacterium]|nr:MurT ligase domain-containing protein [Oscillospiraceae bacterium]